MALIDRYWRLPYLHHTYHNKSLDQQSLHTILQSEATRTPFLTFARKAVSLAAKTNSSPVAPPSAPTPAPGPTRAPAPATSPTPLSSPTPVPAPTSAPAPAQQSAPASAPLIPAPPTVPNTTFSPFHRFHFSPLDNK